MPCLAAGVKSFYPDSTVVVVSIPNWGLSAIDFNKILTLFGVHNHDLFLIKESAPSRVNLDIGPVFLAIHLL
jgi:hypothetical protein